MAMTVRFNALSMMSRKAATPLNTQMLKKAIGHIATLPTLNTQAGSMVTLTEHLKGDNTITRAEKCNCCK